MSVGCCRIDTAGATGDATVLAFLKTLLRHNRVLAGHVIAAYNWSGLYIGGHVGGAWSEVERRYPLADHYVDTPGTVISHEAEGVLAGGHLGLQHSSETWSSAES